ncbi:Jasmonate O-methyltransferase [Acorus gramineus]|uniref:Jasmonate O-methyltransferase n=1 Tax=Acorus gramineus TaxID=55184 RepID=A0AAV9BA27_ACOGR|nr:Jasmonate O-methyltransferase [Acorus gramineus]
MERTVTAIARMRVVNLMKHITLSTIVDMYIATTPTRLAIADLGCSSGPNSLTLIKEIIQSVDEVSHRIDRPPPEFMVSLNDLPANDFNSMFLGLSEFYKKLKRSQRHHEFRGRQLKRSQSVFIVGVPKDLFDENGECINKGNIYISPMSPPSVVKAYEKQFAEDFNLFLRSRSAELTLGGRMVLIMAGRAGRDSWGNGITFLWDVLAQAFSIMVSLGKVEEDKEIEEVVQREGSLVIDKSEMFSTSEMLRRTNGRDAVRSIRAIQESMMDLKILDVFQKDLSWGLLRSNLIPEGVLHKLEEIRRRFYWNESYDEGRKAHLVRWDLGETRAD